jgi:simple sugar transport system permease protein
MYLELDAIIAVVIGGTNLTGGRPVLIGSLVGAVLMQTLTVTMQMHNVPTEQGLIVKAGVAVVVCVLQGERAGEMWGYLRGARSRAASA